jgi:hypothetical protein
MSANEWVKMPWDGNPDMNLECWRKKFGRGHVSVGCGEFTAIVYSHGRDSDESLCGTRWNYEETPLTEEEAMEEVDAQHGFYSSEIRHPRRLKCLNLR